MSDNSNSNNDENFTTEGPAEFWVSDDYSKVYLIYEPQKPMKNRKQMVRTFVEIAIALSCEELGITRAELLGMGQHTQAVKSGIAEA